MRLRWVVRNMLGCALIAGLLVASIALAAPHLVLPARSASSVRVTYQGKTVIWWARHAVAARREANARRRAIVWQQSVIRRQRSGFVHEVWPRYEHAAVLAAIAYGVDADTLIRKGRCESANWTKFHNTSGASGPWQFLPSTWRSTPYASFSPYDPDAAALAAAWMHDQGRGGEWVCQ